MNQRSGAGLVKRGLSGLNPAREIIRAVSLRAQTTNYLAFSIIAKEKESFIFQEKDE